MYTSGPPFAFACAAARCAQHDNDDVLMDNGKAASGGYAAVAPIEQLLRPPVGRESYLKLCTLGEGGRTGGAGLSSEGRTQHPPPSPSSLLLFFSSPSLLSPLPIPFHSPPRSRSPPSPLSFFRGPARYRRSSSLWVALLVPGPDSEFEFHPRIIVHWQPGTYTSSRDLAGLKEARFPPGRSAEEGASPGVVLSNSLARTKCPGGCSCQSIQFFFPIPCQGPCYRNTYRTLPDDD